MKIEDMELVKTKYETSQADGIHHQLALLTGTWAGSSRSWFEKEMDIQC